MATHPCAAPGTAAGVPTVDQVMGFRVVLTATGVLATALATTYVIKTGTAASVQDGQAPRTVIATPGPAKPHSDPEAVTVTVSPEIPVRVQGMAASQSPTDLRRVAYTVAGNTRPDDAVTVVYADETGTLQRAENVRLPWTLTITPDLPVSYVYATSRGSQLNCWITDAGGSTVVSQTDFSPSATCNR